jgi:hypothetical protein
MKTLLLFLLFLLFVPCVHAQSSQPEPISDNSFLIEEAYNQEPGVVQHINTFVRTRGGDWLYTFTQEWPVKSMKHQLSITLAGSRLDQTNGMGDTAINYRYQLKDSDKVAISPRLSVILPTGDAKRTLGAGGLGIQTNLPVSVKLSDKVVTHWNAGATLTPEPKTISTRRHLRRLSILVRAQSGWPIRASMYYLKQHGTATRVLPSDKTETSYSLLLNPGVRWSHNFKNGLQIVPGVSFPIGIGPSRGERGVFFYLSFEHPFKKVSGE